MDQFKDREVVQAVLIADNNHFENFRPFADETSTALLPLVNVPVIDYALESLNRCGVEEVFVFSRLFINDLRQHIEKQIKSSCSWSLNMKVKIIGGEGCRCYGDALRDLDAKGLLRGHFILLQAETVTNANLIAILEEHKKNSKRDKGTAMTVVFKESAARLPTGNEVVIAMDLDNNRLHYHKRVDQYLKEKNFDIPMEIFINNSQISIHHNIVDPQIAICSPLALPLFSDNFDFGTRDDFIRGLLINEEILDSRIYVSFLSNNQYASTIGNWLTYQTISLDVINRWSYPLVPDMGICCLYQNYVFTRNNIYKSQKAKVSRKVTLKENVVIHEGSSVENGSEITNSVIGRNCKIGENCQLKNAFLMDGVTVGDNCRFEFCVVGADAVIESKCQLMEGFVVKPKEVVKTGSTLTGNEIYLDDEGLTVPVMKFLPNAFDDSDYNSSSDEEESIINGSPIPDDANSTKTLIFLWIIFVSMMIFYFFLLSFPIRGDRLTQSGFPREIKTGQFDS
ncbi:EIF2B5 family protein [Megaselia abdita]